MACPKCNSTNIANKTFTIRYSDENVSFKECSKCGAIFDEEIKRPRGRILKNKYSAADIRFSENEKRNFISFLLQFLDTQNKILAAIATNTVPDDIEKFAKQRLKSQEEFKILLVLDDLDEHGDRS